MTNVVHFPDRARIEEEASQWLIRLDSGGLEVAESDALREWLRACPEHREVLMELCRLWDDMDILSELAELFPLSQREVARCGGSSSARHWLIPSITAAAASVLLALVMLLPQQYFPFDGINADPASGVMTYQSELGKQREIHLPDGSVAELNTDSRLLVDYSRDQRDVRLIRGEAHFQVAHEAERPFVVRAGGGVVRAVGTAFAVRLGMDNVEVTVTEGKVEIASAVTDKPRLFNDNTPLDYLTTVEAGQVAKFGESTLQSLQKIEPEVMSRKLLWKHGMVEFKGEPLAEVIREISRYTDVEISILDDSIRDLRIGGYFKTGEVEALFSVLEKGFPVVVNRADENLIYLTRKDTPGDAIAN